MNSIQFNTVNISSTEKPSSQNRATEFLKNNKKKIALVLSAAFAALAGFALYQLRIEQPKKIVKENPTLFSSLEKLPSLSEISDAMETTYKILTSKISDATETTYKTLTSKIPDAMGTTYKTLTMRKLRTYLFNTPYIGPFAKTLHSTLFSYDPPRYQSPTSLLDQRSF